MNKQQVLIFSSNQKTIENISGQLDKETIDVTSVRTTEEAIEKIHQQDFDLVLLSNELDSLDENKLRKIITIQNPGVIIIKYDNGDTGALNGPITEALSARKNSERPSFSVVDDALKNAGLKINVQ